jgi:hypothetical protein
MPSMTTLNHGDKIRIENWTGSFATVGTLAGFCPEHAERKRAKGEEEAPWTIYTGAAISDSPAFHEKHRADVAEAIKVKDGEFVTIEGREYRVRVLPENGGAFPRNSDPINFEEMTKSDKAIIRDYRIIMDHVERTVASVHGVLTKADIDQVDKLETQLIIRDLSHAMTAENVENYYYNLNNA